MNHAVFTVSPAEMDEPTAEQPRDSDEAAGCGEPSAAAASTAQAIARLLASVLGPGSPGDGHGTLN